ncbi:helix-turn-helix transcriptional regulator [Streptomyces sp. B6B3]|uniref:helix-turn-helix domain-containing protein n=1 Tax=Streptomyces sp. B6B3 TaxID=3153570 RepID=UPI00325E9207
MPPSEEKTNRLPHARRLYAEELRRLREEAGWSLAELGEKSALDRTHLNRLERGERLGERRNAEVLDAVYGTGRHLQNLWTLAKEDAFADKYKRYMELASSATSTQQYTPSVVPGLLQTEAYARELLQEARSGDDLEDQITVRMDRQRRLVGANPIDFRAVIDEAVLRRPLKDPKAWHAQLAHLVELQSLPNVAIQLLPLAVGLHGLTNTHTITMWQPDGTSAAYIETGYSGELLEDPEDVEHLRLAYDRLRDLALSPRKSVEFVEKLMEDRDTCEPPDPT